MDKYEIVRQALTEDISSGDISARLLPKKIINAQVICNEVAVICGLDYFEQAFLQLNARIRISWKIKAGEQVSAGSVLCEIRGDNQSIISAERSALNFLQTLSATATKTQALVRKIAHTSTKILDTRKTLPGLRIAQKKAVVCGGGGNNRLGLYDAIMLKENHLYTLGGLKKALKYLSTQHSDLAIIVEVENLEQLQTALNYSEQIDRILCDNFNLEMLKAAVRLSAEQMTLEASGNINENNIVDYANSGVHYISIGAMTKNIKAIDLSLRFSPF